MEKIGFWLLIVSLFTSGAIFADQTIKELEKKLQEVSGREKIDVLNSLTQNLQTTLSQLTKVILSFEDRLKSIEENIEEE